MEASRSTVAAPQAKSGPRKIFSNYFYWTYPRGSIHYDVMVTLILVFIFVTPRFWDYGAKPSRPGGPLHPIEVIGNDGHGVIVTVEAVDVNIAPGASEREVRKALVKAIEPVTGDAVFIDRWATVREPDGKLAWKVWAHR
ncbi:MAG TPA: hypothetical protein VMA34_06730 [Terracidiphilus sp.]|nr:hypothetical protein [Terracidiphilus sp.]